MRESAIEKAFTEAVKQAGGLALKITPAGLAGFPDRLVIFRGAHIGFVELKQRGQKPTPIQARRHQLLHDFGFTVITLDNTHDIQDTIHAIQAA